MLFLLVLIISVVAGAPAASADPLTITSPEPGLLDTAVFTVTGTATAGDEVQVSSPGRSEPLCITRTATDDTWSCRVELADGPIRVTAVELLAGGGTTSVSVDVAVLSAPVIEAVDGSATSGGTVRGTAYSGATVAVASDGGSSCVATADRAGAWFCQLRPTLGPGSYAVTATQTTDFARGEVSPASTPVTITIDNAPPSAPTLTSPASGAALALTGAVYSGTGENGTTAYVYVDRVNTCEAPVVRGTWSCTGGSITAGAHRVSAILGDEAGNYGVPSPWVDVVFGAATPTPTPTPTAVAPTPQPAVPTPDGSASVPPAAGTPSAVPSRAPAATPAPAVPRPSTPSAVPAPTSAPATPDAAPSSTPGAAPSATPDAGSDAGAESGSDDPGNGGTAPASGWTAATGMTTALSASTATAGAGDWARSLALAVLSLALVVVPARLALAGRAAAPVRRFHVTGRNRAPVEFDDRPATDGPRPWSITAAAVVGAAALAMLAVPLDGGPATLRLLLAMTVAIALVNAVAAGAPALVAHLTGLGSVRPLAAPRALVLVVLAALLSRLVGLDPAFFFGIVVGLVLPDSVPPLGRSVLATARVGSLLLLAAGAWALLQAVPESGTVAALLATEILSATTLIGVGSAVVLLFPVGRPTGAAILRWSPLLWLGLTLTSWTVLFLLLSPTLSAWQENGGGATVLLAVVAFAAVCTSVWAWRRFVDVD